MDTAIHLYTVGKQKEVRAEEFIRRKNYSRGTFVCPECGEVSIYLEDVSKLKK